VLDLIQIPAFLCRQTDLLLAAAATPCWLNVKKGQFLAPQDMGHVVSKVEEVRGASARKLMLTERGSTFGYRDLVVDVRAIPLMADTGCPVIIDATHAVQQPGAAGQVTGGQPRFIPTIAQCGIIGGARGVFMEVHPDPSQAKSDGLNALPLASLGPLLGKLMDLYRWRKEHG
jgi:2-dehydro-3-deoxyphosphooctonate aldolase (KDO 8-P synthase)